MDTLSCKYCTCKEACMIIRNTNKALLETSTDDWRIITNGAAVKHKIYKILANNCTEYKYNGK